ncbi:hypothetical protein Val02_81700 [Virgisporangium aliadipatigenens]|uniref:Recombinase domain-containing protein n=1 Tax=Virgisporangium aliadipatigenens TaxID=741659 RepID=A0A8J3YTA0_9ACTN|nr:recombinase family protein [Virgisporangium aliadipatigenens]GIJ51284.1 hypothetical protein Val02_81700 [Virgisporangium aliadipatigenens]
MSPSSDDVVDPYLRKSKGMSVERQLADITEAADAEGLTLGRTFADPDRSASRHRRREREDFAALVEHIQSGDCRMIGIAEASRGSRDLTEWSGFLDLCRAQKVRILVSTHERVYDLRRRRDWRALVDEGVDAADESEKLSERVRSGKRQAARDGKPAGRLAYGFIRTYDVTGQFVAQLPHPEQAPVVAEMVRRIAEGEALHAIAADLNARGITMAGGAPWRGPLVRQTVLRPAYIGRRVHHGEDVGDATWEPIVDVDEWHRAEAILRHPNRRSTTRGSALTHWLTNVPRCGGCTTGRLVAKTQGASGRPTRYACGACNGVFVHAGRLEDFVQELVLGRLAQPDALAALQPADDPAAREAERTVTKLKERLEEHYAEARVGRLSARGLAVVEAGLLADIAAAESRARRVVLPAALRDVDPAQVIEKWPTMAAKSRRVYTMALVELVVGPAIRRGPGFDRRRLAESRWTGDSMTLGEHGLV